MDGSEDGDRKTVNRERERKRERWGAVDEWLGGVSIFKPVVRNISSEGREAVRKHCDMADNTFR